MKKLLCIALCVIMAFSCFGICAGASEKPDPIILISGFMCSQLFTDFGTENQKKVWGPAAGDFASQTKKDFRRFIKTFVGFCFGEPEEFGITIGDGANEVMEYLKCLPDGSSKYEVQHYPNKAETSNVKYMLSDNDGQYLYEIPFCKFISEKTDPGRVFCFQYDSRLDSASIAVELQAFIKDVKEYTGSSQVSLVALSYGGLITATYLAYYGAENDVGRVVLSVPALGGTNIPGRILRGEIDVSDESLLSFIETALGGRSNMARIFEIDRAEWLDALGCGASGGLGQMAKNWPSFWCLCSREEYDELKAEFLDPVDNKGLIEKTDKVHYEVMNRISEIFAECRSRGTQISIICGTGSGLCVGGDLNGDVILPASGVSGAKTAPLGKRFADGYTGVKTSCADPSHNHISPSMEVDASCAYLPENTWFVENHYHGQYYYEEYTRTLVEKLLTTDEIKDVHSDPKYPQFENSNNAYRSIHISFDNSAPGYISSKDKVLKITNITDGDYIKLLSVVTNGIELDFHAFSTGFLSPGETVEIPFEGEIPAVSVVPVNLTVNYIRVGSLNPWRSAVYDFTIINGAPAEYKGGFADAGPVSLLQQKTPKGLFEFLQKISFRQKIECIFDTFSSFFD